MGIMDSALPIIVKNYSRAFGIEVRMQGMNAYTNGRTITIPRLDLSDPLISRLAYAYLAHESAHIRYTDFDIVASFKQDFLKFTIFNILEDARVESLIGRDYIGVWENLCLLRVKHCGWDQFEREIDRKSSLQILLALMMNYAACYCQKFVSLRKRTAFLLLFLRKECPHDFLNDFCRLTRKITAAGSSAEVALLVDDIYEMLQQRFKCSKGCHKSLLDKNTSDAAQGNELFGFKESLEEFMNSTQGSISKAVMATELSEIIEGLCERNSSARDDFGLMSAKDCRRGREHFIRQTACTTGLRQNLSSVMKSYSERLSGSFNKGKTIDARKASMIPLGQEDIFRNKTCFEDFKTSVHLLVDVSGSMMTCDGGSVSRCENACICALSLALALEGISGIKSMASFFPGVSSEVEIALRSEEKASIKASYFDQSPRGSTPLAQAIWYAVGMVGELDCNRNIIIVITDGIPDSISQSRLAVSAAKKAGIEIYAIGIKLKSIHEILENSFVIESASELNRAVEALFKHIFAPLSDADARSV